MVGNREAAWTSYIADVGMRLAGQALSDYNCFRGFMQSSTKEFGDQQGWARQWRWLMLCGGLTTVCRNSDWVIG